MLNLHQFKKILVTVYQDKFHDCTLISKLQLNFVSQYLRRGCKERKNKIKKKKRKRKEERKNKRKKEKRKWEKERKKERERRDHFFWSGCQRVIVCSWGGHEREGQCIRKLAGFWCPGARKGQNRFNISKANFFAEN